MNETEKLELSISKFLRYGVILTGILMTIGWFSHLTGSSVGIESYNTYQEISLVESIKLHFAEGHLSILISYLGLGILILLPIIRVFLTGVVFFIQKDWLLSGIAGVVLLCLLYSLMMGIEL